MTATICGHERKALLEVLGLVVKTIDVHTDGCADLIAFYRANFNRLGLMLQEEEAAFFVITDPANLAELIAEEARRCGLKVATRGHSLPVDVYVKPRHGSVGIRFPHDDGFAYELPQARTILSQLLQLPPGASKDAERVLRGET